LLLLLLLAAAAAVRRYIKLSNKARAIQLFVTLKTPNQFV
jgi:hypothetical protein